MTGPARWPAGVAEYRGVTTPTQVAPATAVVVPPKVVAPTTKPELGYNAADVLSASIVRWGGPGLDGPLSVVRCLPDAPYVGVAPIDSLRTDDEGEREQATSGVTMAPGGLLLYGAACEWGAKTSSLLTARVDDAGLLTAVGRCRVPTMVVGAPVLMRGAFVASPCQKSIEVAALAHSGSATATGTYPLPDTPGDIAMLSASRMLVPCRNQIFVLEVSGSGTVSELCPPVRVDEAGGHCTVVMARPGLAVVTNETGVHTFRFDGQTLVPLSGNYIAFKDSQRSPAFVSSDGLVATTCRRGALHAFALDAQGRLEGRGTFIADGDMEHAPVIARGHVLATCGDELHSFAVTRSGLKRVDTARAGSTIKNRPTVTRDNVALLTALDAKAYAIALGSNGKLVHKESLRLSAMVNNPLVVMPNGTIVAQGGDLLTLGRDTGEST